MSKKKVLEIGCGLRPFFEKGCKAIHLDKLKFPHVEVVHDLNKFPYPFKNNEFDEIIASHVLEHLDDIPKVMEELYRILKPNGILKIRVPFFANPLSFTSPTHKHFFTSFSFNYWDDTTALGRECRHEVRKKARFKIIKKEFRFHRYLKFMTLFANMLPEIYEFSILSRIFPALEIYFELKNRLSL